jgi:hypothetical protein
MSGGVLQLRIALVAPVLPQGHQVQQMYLNNHQAGNVLSHQERSNQESRDHAPKFTVTFILNKHACQTCPGKLFSLQSAYACKYAGQAWQLGKRRDALS